MMPVPDALKARPPTPTSAVASATDEDVLCPLCEYNLRGLVEPRCPECGYRFEWSELLDASLRPPALLFEHARRRWVRSFVCTRAAGWLPPLFFGRWLRPSYAVVGRRLLVYWWLSVMTFLLVPLGTLAFFLASYSLGSSQTLSGALDVSPQVAAAWFTENRAFVPAITSALVLWAAWPWLTYGALLIFTDSMRRANVKREHVMRCAIYSCDAALSAGALACWLYWWRDDVLGIMRLACGTPAAIVAYVSCAYAAVTTFRLAHAYQLYLRFPHALLTAVLSQVVVLLCGWLFAALVWEFVGTLQ